MDFLDPKKKRAHNIRLFIGYFLVGVMLLITTTILVFQASGYDVDRKTGAVIQNGLLFLDAHPESATIYLNGIEKGQTDARFVLPAGTYDIELKRDGYRSWKQQVTLRGSVIDRLVYPFLFPTTLQSKELQRYTTAPTLFTESPDRKWLLAQKPASLTDIDVVDLANKANPIKTITLAGDLMTPAEGAHQLELVEWSTDNRRVLVKHTFTGGAEFITIDRESPEQSVNLNKLFGVAFSQIRLQDKKYDKLYVYTAEGGILQTADVKTKLITPLLTKVLTFQPHGDDILLYTTDESTSADKVAVRIRERLSTYTLRELPKNSAYLLDVARFDGDWYMVAGAATENRVYVYKNPLDDLKKESPEKPIPSTILRVEGAQFVSFSTNARFIALQGNSKFAVFDAENERSIQYDSTLALPAGYKATWMDGHRLLFNVNGKMTVLDYNGTNVQTLVDALPGFMPSFDRNYEALFTLKTIDGQVSLQRTELRLPPF